MLRIFSKKGQLRIDTNPYELWRNQETAPPIAISQSEVL